MTTIWEPWTPEVGQRVAFHRGECPENHGPVPDGATGFVGVLDGIPWTENVPSTGHRLALWLDDEVIHADGFVQSGMAVAVCELVPMDDH